MSAPTKANTRLANTLRLTFERGIMHLAVNILSAKRLEMRHSFVVLWPALRRDRLRGRAGPQNAQSAPLACLGAFIVMHTRNACRNMDNTVSISKKFIRLELRKETNP